MLPGRMKVDGGTGKDLFLKMVLERAVPMEAGTVNSLSQGDKQTVSIRTNTSIRGAMIASG